MNFISIYLFKVRRRRSTTCIEESGMTQLMTPEKRPLNDLNNNMNMSNKSELSPAKSLRNNLMNTPVSKKQYDHSNYWKNIVQDYAKKLDDAAHEKNINKEQAVG